MIHPARIRTTFFLVVGLLMAVGGTARAESPQQWAETHLDELVKLYRQLHANPELSFQEVKTAARLADELRETGAEVTTGVGGHGVVAILENGEGPTLMLRADLDALPVTELTGLVYASQVRVEDEEGREVGVMHACGHDVHMTNLVGVARYLAAHRDKWQGTLMMIGQPAEEVGAGALAMIDDGLFERFPRPDFAVALHVNPNLAAGKVGVRGGYALANVDSVDILLRGKGGHGAQPHTTVDPIVQAAQLIVSLQTIVSREIKPLEPAVVTVGSIQGGTKHNIIPNECHLQLTVRSYSDEVRQQLLEAIERKAKAVAAGMRAPEPEINVSEGTPALFNDEELAAHLRGVFEDLLGEDRVIEPEPSMGGEDFGRYGREGVPIVMYALGSIEKKRLERYEELGQSPPSLHSPHYYPDVEPTLVTGIRTMVAVALDLLPPPAED